MNRNHKFNMGVFTVIAPAPSYAKNSYIETCAEPKSAAAYKEDDEFFRAHPQRTHFLRAAYEKEFSFLTVATGFLEIPEQVVHVSKLSIGTYECRLVFYGREHANQTPHNDEQVIQLLLKMQRECSGYACPEMNAFLDRAQENTLADHPRDDKKAN